MNIKIFTFYNTNNYGALLQSLCLKEFLRENFNLKIEYARYLPKKLIFREIYRPLITKNPFKFYQSLKKNYNLSKWKKKMNLPTPKFTKKINNPTISVYGSDSIWHLFPYLGFEAYFFGEKNDGFKIKFWVLDTATPSATAARLGVINPPNSLFLFVKFLYSYE
mgnify:CR=1 FL=1